MPPPLLKTKLYLPRPRPGLVPRQRLSEHLEAAAPAKLVLVSAPAGFGKTTLLAAWLTPRLTGATPARSVAWLSLDRADNDPVSFWRYVVAALRTALPAGIGERALSLLESPQPPPIVMVLTTLLNDLGAGDGDGDVVLVLDDYHLIDSRDVQQEMSFFLDHLPPRLQVIIASRADPAMPLALLRARGELIEIRAADLRFTHEEAATYLNESMGLQLRPTDVATLDQRTEGWIAALQLAALSVQGRADVAGFIAGFTGDDRYIVDYLVEEVLERQPADVRDFLLQTSVISRLNGSLCDAVTATSGSKAMLDLLERGNLFVVPLDDRREWYRYHHLFADVLRARIVDESPELVDSLHLRASDWCAEHGDRSEAIEHAIAGGHVGRAADLIELALPALAKDRQEAAVRAWVERLPADLLTVRPVLSNGYAGALMSTGAFEGAEQHLRAAEEWLDGAAGAGSTPMVVADAEGLRRLPAGLAVHRAGLALVAGDLEATIAHARRALDLLGNDSDLATAAATALIGLACWSSGDLPAARTAYVTSLAAMQRAGHLADVLGLSLALADIQVTQGALHEAMRTYDHALTLAPTHGVPALRGTADMYVGMCELHLERNDLHAARQLWAQGEELGEHNGLPQNPYRRRVAMARILRAEGSLEQAVDLLDAAEGVYVGDFSPDVHPVPAIRARLWIAQGRTADALAWSRQRALSVDDELSYLHEYEHVTLARVLLALATEVSLDQAIKLLAGLARDAEAGQRTGTLIEVLVLQALAEQQHGDVPAALVPLERALSLAEPEGYVRIFLDEGPAMTALLRRAAAQGIARDHAGRLIAAETTSSTTPDAPHLVDPLSPRELDVLRILATDLSGPEIADELVVSLNTVRTHTKSIYAKLGVNSRRAAVRRGQELDLMLRTRHR